MVELCRNPTSVVTVLLELFLYPEFIMVGLEDINDIFTATIQVKIQPHLNL